MSRLTGGLFSALLTLHHPWLRSGMNHAASIPQHAEGAVPAAAPAAVAGATAGAVVAGVGAGHHHGPVPGPGLTHHGQDHGQGQPLGQSQGQGVGQSPPAPRDARLPGTGGAGGVTAGAGRRTGIGIGAPGLSGLPHAICPGGQIAPYP